MKGVISLKKRIIPLILLLAMLLSLSAYAASPRVMTILPAISFDGIKTDHTDTLTLEGNYRDYNFSDLANYEFFSTSESVTKTLNYIRSELLKKFK